MTSEFFNTCINRIKTNTTTIMQNRNSNYGKGNPLHNFEEGSKFTGLTPAQTAWGYMIKHLVSLKDKIDSNDFSNENDLLEKCTDITNYIALIYTIGCNENKIKKEVMQNENHT